jgi:hypothetical protein
MCENFENIKPDKMGLLSDKKSPDMGDRLNSGNNRSYSVRMCNDMPIRYTGTSSPLGFLAAVAINMGWFG